ncbi:MAG TPA: diguanylate cyclase [Rhodocyclaceae bacterium]|nr:diguanylate cyclase [Rhodocyclaceae bacterium]
MLKRIRYRILLVISIVVSLGLIATAAYYTRYQENAMLSQNEQTMRRLTDSLIQGLQSVMLAGSADIAQVFAERLRHVPDISEFRIMRTNGMEAFRDNKTIDDVNRRRGEEVFLTREKEESNRIMTADDTDLRRAVATKEPVAVYGRDANGNRTLTFIAPIVASDVCFKCHGKAQAVRGAIRLTTSLASVERDIMRVRYESIIIVALALLGTMLLTGYMMGRLVVKPIEAVTRAMMRVSGGDLNHLVEIEGQDELGRMAKSFNRMTKELKNTYRGLQREQDKLTTVIESATEGMVVTDADLQVVLVNPAAVALLGKSTEEIVTEDFMQLVDDPDLLHRAIDGKSGVEIRYNDLVLQVYVTSIYAMEGRFVGMVALIRNVTEEKRLEEEMRRLATTDGLTGLYNRRFLDATLSTEFQRAMRTGATLSLIIFDVDHFKKFNDAHGHDQGDRVLQMVARCMRATVRSFDFPCRYGGEEFVAILPNMDSSEARNMAEALRIAVARTEVDGLFVHISLGVATYPGLKPPPRQAEALLEAADAALYRAKESGRNRVVVAETSA